MRIVAPIGVLNFLKIASEQQVLIKDGRALESLCEVDTVVFDKTGTLTQELPHVKTIHCAASQSEADILRAAAAAEYKQKHPIAWVSYPGLPGHPQHDVAARLLTHGFGGIIAMRVSGGREAIYRFVNYRFVNALTLFDIAVNLGDLFTLIYPIPEQDNLIRISVGCEDVDDILADFEQALASICCPDLHTSKQLEPSIA